MNIESEVFCNKCSRKGNFAICPACGGLDLRPVPVNVSFSFKKGKPLPPNGVMKFNKIITKTKDKI